MGRSFDDRPPLTPEDAALIKGMLKRGDLQSDIAAFFGTNGGRISEINTGHRYPEVHAVPEELLPPPGPYLAGRSALKAKDTLSALRDLIDDSLNTIDLFENVREKDRD
jgi:hypothetical protein